MPRNIHRRSNRWPALLLVWILVAGCSSAPNPRTSQAPATANAAGRTESNQMIITRTPAAVITPGGDAAVAAAATGAPSKGLLTLAPLPASFRFEILLRSANAPDAPDTELRGAYRGGAWQQVAHTRTAESGAAPDQEMISAGGSTYTRPAGDPEWTRWPGTSFDAAYGMTSPFAVLRLYSMASQKARGEAASLPGVTEPVYRVQAAITADAVQQLAKAGAAALVPDPEEQASLLEQVAPLAVPQTITYWVGDSGRIYQAAATLVTADANGQPSPWMQVTWRFTDHDDSGIAVAAPQNYRDAPLPGAAEADLATPIAEETSSNTANLTIHVYASPGVPAENLAVTIYPAGNTREPIDWRNQAEAKFELPPGRYDALVQTDYAQEWLRGLEVKTGAPVARDVTFDFGTLKLAVLRDGKPIPVDIVTYPAGNRQNWVDWRSDNPATVQLRSGLYDVEIAYDNYGAHETVTGLQVKAGETTEQTIEVTK